MNATTQETEKRLAQLKKEVPTRGFERHPVFIKSLGELPPELCSPQLTEETGATMIVFPPQIQRGRHYVPRQALFFTADGVTHALASIWPGQPPQVTRLSNRDILYTRVTLLLLYGFLEVVGCGVDAPTRLAMEFNTVAWDKLAAPLRRLVESSRGGHIPPANPQPLPAEVRSRREGLPLKFKNGIRIHGLLEGEELQELVFQPGVRERLLFLFHRAVLANTLVLLTGQFVVVIQEELKVAQGWVVSYIPRGNITQVTCQAKAEWNELVFQLDRDGQTAEYVLRLGETVALEWKGIWEKSGGRWKDLPTIV